MNLTNKQIINYLKKENKYQLQVYTRKVQQGTMHKDIANRQYLIIKEYAQIIEQIEAAGISYTEFKKIIDNISLGPKNQQQKLF